MLVAPQTIEASLVARRLQRWGGQTCMVSDVAVAQALAAGTVLACRAARSRAGRDEVETLGEAARRMRRSGS